MRRSAGLAVLFAVLVAAGCGESAKEKYRNDLAPLNDRIVALGKQVGATIDEAGGRTDAQLADAFGDYARELGDVQQQLEQLEPPEDLADEQSKLVEAMGDVQGALARIADAALSGNPDAAREATVELIPGSRSLSEAREALARAVG
jgi:thymidine phosphorylase